jgi:NitT/TauT family transport system substrate-binding protein
MKARYLRFASLLVVVVVLLGISGCAPTPTPERPPLKVAYVLWPGYLPIVIADEKGFFDEENVGVEVIYPESSAQARADLSAGTLDGLTFTLAGIVGAAGEGSDIHVVFATDESSGADAVVAGADIQSVADLVGERVGVGFGGYGEIIVDAMLEVNGLTRQDVILVDMFGEDVPAGVANGDVAAGVTWEPYVSQAVGEGAQVLFSTADTPGLIPDAMAFHGSTLRERPDDVRAFVRAWFRAVDWWLANLDDGYALLAEALDMEPASASLEGIKLLTLQDNLNAFQPGTTSESLYYTAQLYADFYIGTGALGAAPDLDVLLDPSFLE